MNIWTFVIKMLKRAKFKHLCLFLINIVCIMFICLCSFCIHKTTSSLRNNWDSQNQVNKRGRLAIFRSVVLESSAKKVHFLISLIDICLWLAFVLNETNKFNKLNSNCISFLASRNQFIVNYEIYFDIIEFVLSCFGHHRNRLNFWKTFYDLIKIKSKLLKKKKWTSFIYKMFCFETK